MKPQLQLPGQRIWRRNLPVPGNVLVSPGDAVQPDTLLAEGEMATPPVVVELGEAQAVVLTGQDVLAGEVVARRKKRLGRDQEVVSPIAGKVLLVQGSQLLLQPPALMTSLEAQLPGVVAAVRAGWGADVDGCFGLLRGCRGWGASLYGRLGEDVAVAPEPLTAGRLQTLASQGIRAVIAPSWEERPASQPRDVTAVFLTEPLPGRAMSPPIAEVLQAHLGQTVALKLGIEPLGAFASASSGDQQCFGPGAWLRAADGRAGRLVGVGDAPRFFESGARAVPAEVDFGDHTETLPLDSLEWIA